MKKSFIHFLFSISCLYGLNAQTNTFPSSGNVGIGTTTPSEELEIKGGDGVGISLYNDQANYWDIINSQYGKLDFVRGKTNTYMRIDQSGNVGIGTTSPSERLHVNGLIRIPAATSEDNNSPGITLASNDDFLYDNQYINHYGFGFHGYQDGSTYPTEPMNSYMSGYFGIDFFTAGQNRLRISHLGEVSIGTATRQPGYKLAVNGNIKAKEIKVETGWSDFVFEEDYDLPTLEEVEIHIKEKGHLKDIPSAKDVAENGILLGEMDSKLLQKIEELTLYTINQEKRIEDLESKNQKLIKIVEKLLKEN